MGFNVTYTWASGDTLTYDELNQNFADIVSLLDGGLTGSNLSASAGIGLSQLDSAAQELVLSLTLKGTQLNGDTNQNYVIGGMPYDGTMVAPLTYTVMGIEHAFVEDGAGTGATTAAVFSLKYGDSVAGFSDIKTGISVGLTAGQTAETGFTSSITVGSARPKYFYLDTTTQGAAYVDGDSWAIFIKLKRDIRA